MGKAEQRAKDAKMAADLKARGIPHGKRMTKGLSNVPDPRDRGSAAYRRLLAKKQRGKGRGYN